MSPVSSTSFPTFTIEGYPRVGANRELKKALESFWAGRIDEAAFTSAAHSIRLDNYARLRDLGLDQDYAIPADVALYDQVLETAVTVGLIGGEATDIDFTEYFALARGNAERAPLEMTKWFDTNYHYLVPEVSDDTVITPRPQRILDIVAEAKAAGHLVRPFLVGPVTLLALSKPTEDAAEDFSPLARLTDLIAAYTEVLAALAGAGVEWVQIIEPALTADLTVASDADLAADAAIAYGALLAEVDRPQVLLSTPYGSLRQGLDAVISANPEALQVDLAPVTLTADPEYPQRVAAAVAGTDITLAAGVIDGRNIWAADLRERLEVLETLRKGGVDKLAVTSSVSLQHVPHTVAVETNLPVDVAGWLSFADEKVGEAKALATALGGDTVDAADAFARSDRAVRTRRESARTHNRDVQDRVAALPDGQVARSPEFAERVEVQKSLGLPTLPTTTIGSFPQTPEIRKARADHRVGTLTDDQYTEALKDEVRQVIELQERLGIDVLVHGEPERNDMVQYFAELLDGFVTTEHGWVQSYGSRCTRPSIVVGDVSRPAPMTVEWAKYAQSLSERHVKGMLTGPVTILAWSFTRDDVPKSVSADQIALALADEVADLEAAGIDIIQIDEPALRELLPLREDARPAYLDWAVRSFRLVALDANPATQIHTHLCYSEFGQIIDAVAALDADVTSIEAARSRMELLTDLDESFHSEIGPGIWDIHSPRVPDVAELSELIKAALVNVPTERLWINPDCGLKTRGYAEVEPALRNMVLARDLVVESLAVKV